MMANLIWNDPDYIEGNDYRIVSMEVINDEIAFIKYNQGLSEAEVFLSEIVTVWLVAQGGLRFPPKPVILHSYSSNPNEFFHRQNYYSMGR